MGAETVYYEEETWEELINGRIVMISPRPTVNHNTVSDNICILFRMFIKNAAGSKCRAFSDGVDLYLTETERYIPDGMVVCDPDKIKYDGVHGAPDLVVEVLSPSTMRNDRDKKKAVYEKCGVREYWIVNPADKSIEQYFLEGGRFVLNDIYVIHPDYMLKKMKDEEKAAIVTEFKCSLSDELVLRLEDIFADMI